MRILILSMVLFLFGVLPALAESNVTPMTETLRPAIESTTNKIVQQPPQQIKESNLLLRAVGNPIPKDEVLPDPIFKMPDKNENKIKTVILWVPRVIKNGAVSTWNTGKLICYEANEFRKSPRQTAKRWDGDGTLAFGQVLGTGAGILAGVSTTIFAAGR